MSKSIFLIAVMSISFAVAEGQDPRPPRGVDPIPPDWLQKPSPRAPLDSMTMSLERRNALAGLRRPSKTSPKNIIELSSTSRTTKEQDALYLGQLENKQVYRVNTSAVVSKNVGETEKNLDRVFAEAASKKAILFFDDANLLFSNSAQPDATAKYLEKLAQSKNVTTIIWCEDDCLKALRR